MNSQTENNELVDRVANRVTGLMGANPPVRRLRKSQVLSAIVGAVGFALFIDGVLKLAIDIPTWTSLTVGLALMAATGTLLHNLNR
jgi:hypothetical protein